MANCGFPRGAQQHRLPVGGEFAQAAQQFQVVRNRFPETESRVEDHLIAGNACRHGQRRGFLQIGADFGHQIFVLRIVLQVPRRAFDVHNHHRHHQLAAAMEAIVRGRSVQPADIIDDGGPRRDRLSGDSAFVGVYRNGYREVLGQRVESPARPGEFPHRTALPPRPGGWIHRRHPACPRRLRSSAPPAVPLPPHCRSSASPEKESGVTLMMPMT